MPFGDALDNALAVAAGLDFDAVAANEVALLAAGEAAQRRVCRVFKLDDVLAAVRRDDGAVAHALSRATRRAAGGCES